jgi:hypothetical protein
VSAKPDQKLAAAAVPVLVLCPGIDLYIVHAGELAAKILVCALFTMTKNAENNLFTYSEMNLKLLDIWSFFSVVPGTLQGLLFLSPIQNQHHHPFLKT